MNLNEERPQRGCATPILPANEVRAISGNTYSEVRSYTLNLAPPRHGSFQEHARNAV